MFSVATYAGDIIFSLVCLTVIRLFILYLRIQKNRKTLVFNDVKRKATVKTLIVLGSGGHTSEMLTLVKPLSPSFHPRIYVMASSDEISEQKVHAMEKAKLSHIKFKSESWRKYFIERIPRSREVKQSWISTVLTTAKATLASVPVVFRHRPDLIICNGPGTCIPICVLGIILSVIGIKRVTIIFVESFCRVNTMSLSGRILYYFADHFLVQWPNLLSEYPNAKYIGILI